MKVLAEISDEDYELLKYDKYETLTIKRQVLLANNILNSVRKGIPLPKGHGKIVDESKITEVYFTQIEGKIINGIKMPDRNMITGTNASIIIEADKESE